MKSPITLECLVVFPYQNVIDMNSSIKQD